MHKINLPFAAAVLLVLLIFEITLCPLISIGGAIPHPLIIAVAFFALFGGRGVGLRAGLIAGVMLDVCGIRFPGLCALLLAVGGYVIGANSTRFYKDSPVTHIILSLALYGFFLLSRLILQFAVLHPYLSRHWSLGFLASIIIPPVLYTTLLSPFVFLGLSRLFCLREEML